MIPAVSAAQATTYSNDFYLPGNTIGCGYYVNVEICAGAKLLRSAINPVVGDQLKLHVTTDGTISVPASRSANTTFGLYLQQQAIGGPATNGPYATSATLDFAGYAGPLSPGGSSTTPPLLLNSSAGYNAFGGFGFGYGVPNAGYSFTGFDSTATVTGVGPQPIYAIVAGYSIELPSTPRLIADIAGGTPGHPVLLPGGEIGQVSTNIAGAGSRDFYGFNWSGGLFQALGSVAGAPPGESYRYQLLNADGSLVLTNELLDGSNGFTDLIAAPLVTGRYEIGVIADGPTDPRFTVHFNTPVAGVAEPATWALSIAGWAVLGARLRGRRRTVAGRSVRDPGERDGSPAVGAALKLR